MSRKLKIGVFGFYSYRNLGDNLMARLVAEQIKESGHEPVIFCKLADPRVKWGFEVMSSVADFVNSVDGVILGGGGLLIPRPRPSEISKDFHVDLQSLLSAAEIKDTPLFGVSLGGSGASLEEIVPQVRQDLVRRMRYITLRNREDVQLVEQANTKGEFLDDIVWTTSRKIPVKPVERSARLRVGMNLYLGKSRKMLPVKLMLKLITRLRSDVDFIFYEIHPELDGTSTAFAVNLERANCSRKELLDINEACQEVSSLDLLITTRLHLGVMAMSYGVPSIAFAGAEKTRLLYKRAGRSSYFWKAKEFPNFLKLFLTKGALAKVLATSGKIVPDEIMESALTHYERISMYCDMAVDHKRAELTATD